MKLLEMLTRFYQDEARGLGHYDDELLELGWEMADALERAGVDSNAWKFDEEDFVATLHILRTAPTVVLIDNVVNRAHQGLLDAVDRSGEESEAMLMLGGDVVEYLLNREKILAQQGWA